MDGKVLKARKATPWIRRGLQVFFFLLVASIATGGILEERGIKLPFLEGASLHAICPFVLVSQTFSIATTSRAFSSSVRTATRK